MPKRAWGALQWCPVTVVWGPNPWKSVASVEYGISPDLILTFQPKHIQTLQGLMTEAHCLLAKPAFILLDEWTGLRVVASWGAFCTPCIIQIEDSIEFKSISRSQSHDWYWLAGTSLVQNSWRRFAFFFFTVVKISRMMERKVDSCPLYLLDLFLLHTKKLTNSIHENSHVHLI